jgi:hypothetical protein
MGDISREGDEQFAGERYDRNAAGPAALGTDALAEPMAESTVRPVSHPHPGKLDHRGAQPWIVSLRDAQFVVDAATLPWAGSQARIGCQLREPACACAGALSKSGESATQERE